METILFLSLFCLIAFMILATYDGAYLHLWKFELFNKQESTFEHKTHTIRAFLFPIIVWLLFVNTDAMSFYIGIALVTIDLIVLGVDAYSEKESRTFMDGLPKWEYILHLFANSFHFAAVILVISTRLKIEGNSILYSLDFLSSTNIEIVQFVGKNILPGAVVLAFLHVVLSYDFGKKVWNINRQKITCC